MRQRLQDLHKSLVKGVLYLPGTERSIWEIIGESKTLSQLLLAQLSLYMTLGLELYVAMEKCTQFISQSFLSSANVSLSNWSVGSMIIGGEWHSDDHRLQTFFLPPEARLKEQGVLSFMETRVFKACPRSHTNCPVTPNTHIHTHLEEKNEIANCLSDENE